MATYYDGLNYIYKLFEAEPPPSAAQLVMLHLLHENNCLGNPGTVQLTDRQLGHRTSLSNQTITEAKRQLKNRGLIDFKTDRSKPRRGTTYTLKFFCTDGQSKVQNPVQTLGQKVGQNESLPIDAREEKREKKFLSSSRAWELDEALEYWSETLRGARLSFEHQSEIQLWLQRHGLDFVKQAMKDASDANSNQFGLSMKLLRAVVERKLHQKVITAPAKEKIDPSQKFAEQLQHLRNIASKTGDLSINF